jgi:hypothetical protein
MPYRLVHGLGQAGGGDQVPVKHPYRRPVQGPGSCSTLDRASTGPRVV